MTAFNVKLFEYLGRSVVEGIVQILSIIFCLFHPLCIGYNILKCLVPFQIKI